MDSHLRMDVKSKLNTKPKSSSDGHIEEDRQEVTLSRLRAKLASQSQSAETVAIDLARLIAPNYVSNDSFLQLFLRAENHDIKRTIERLRSHFRKKLELFGPNRLGNPITFDDLFQVDKASLSSSGAVLLSEKDSCGRLILVMRYRKMKSTEIASMSRALWFLMMTALEAGLVQNDGTVWIVVDSEDNDDSGVRATPGNLLPAEVASCALSLPVRVAALHFCTFRKTGDDPHDALTESIAASSNIQTQFHYGSPLNWAQELDSSGIPQHSFLSLFEKRAPRKRIAEVGTAGVAAKKAQRRENDGPHTISTQGQGFSKAALVSQVSNDVPSGEKRASRKGGLLPTRTALGLAAANPTFPPASSGAEQKKGVKRYTGFFKPLPAPMGLSKSTLQTSPTVSLQQPVMPSSLTNSPISLQLPQNIHLLPLLSNVTSMQANAANLSSLTNELPLLLGGMPHSQGPGAVHPSAATQSLLNPAIAHMIGNAHRIQSPNFTTPSRLAVSDTPGSSANHTISLSQTGACALGMPQQQERLNSSSTSLAPVRRTRSKLLYSESDDTTLSAYQCLVRQQIEMFEATEDDVQFNISKMSKSVVRGQVGIRCRHCASLPEYSRPKAAVYYPRTLDSLYQFGQNMVKNHLCVTCESIPEETKKALIALQQARRRGKGGRERWAQAARQMNVYEDEHGLRFK